MKKIKTLCHSLNYLPNRKELFKNELRYAQLLIFFNINYNLR